MNDQPLSDEFLKLIRQVKGKRARIVIDHILEHGFITTEDLETRYGYKHPPRAIRDVRDQGIPIETFSVKNTSGRTIAAYRFADSAQIRAGRIGGRKSFSQQFKQQLVEANNGKCSICSTPYAPRYLQFDHRIPYEVAGDVSAERSLDDYMLLCGSCNRAKSWSCEHCHNWLELKNPDLCKGCYWASPTAYEHIALRSIRRLDLVWTEDEIDQYEQLKLLSQHDETIAEYVKSILRKHIQTGE